MELYTKIAGNYYLPEESKRALLNLYIGAELKLEREPDSTFDSNAIKVIYEDCINPDVLLGYIPKQHNVELASAMDNGAEFSCAYKGSSKICVMRVDSS